MSALPRPRDVLGQFGIYVHVPFCVHRCWYCDFAAFAGLDELAPAYMEALTTDAREARSAAEPLLERPDVTSIFIGGGTPSRVEAQQIAAVLRAIGESWSVSPSAEITIECNPESATSDKLEAYRRAGINRVSFGVQSFDDRLLQSLGRAHDAEEATRAIQRAQQAGFDEINLDLIFGIPGESDQTWKDTLERAVELGTGHISAYALTYEEGTPMDEWRKLGRITPVQEDDVAGRYEAAHATLTSAGFERYEVSNWARTSRCRHNELYWTCGEYLGIGVGAHSHLDATRSWTVRAPKAYIERVEQRRSPVAGSETIDAATRRSEVLFLGLRTTDGVSRARFRALSGSELDTAPLAKHIANGLVTDDGETIRLTDRGMLLANAVLTDVLALDAIEC